MKLFEILNTKVNVKWTSTLNGERGSFILDDENYNISIDEYEINQTGKTLIDFGFDRDGNINAVNSNKNASKIIGAILNAGVPKIKRYNPDFVMITVYKKSGLVESRKSLYTVLAKWLQKKIGIMYISEWEETNEAYLKILSLKDKPSNEEINSFILATKLK